MSVIYKTIGTEDSKASQEKANLFPNNNQVNKQPTQNKCLYIRPISSIEKNDEKIHNLIFSSFNDPAYFFSKDSPVQIGTRIHLKNMDLLSQKDKHKNTYSLKSPVKKVNISTRNTVTDVSKSLYTIKEKQDKQSNKSLMQNREIIDNNSLKSIFDGYKDKINKNRNLRKNENSFSRSVKDASKSIIYTERAISKIKTRRTSNEKEEEFPFDLYRSLNYQNSRIRKELNYYKQNKNLSRILSKKTNKNENDLLFNKVDLFKYKKEILQGINKEKLPEKFQWNISLRVPNNFKGKRDYSINVNNDRNPFWGVMVVNDQKELSVKPGYNLNQKEFLKFSKDIKLGNLSNDNNVKGIKNLDDLNVVGNNLLELEYKREMSTKGRKILHKAFIENGKAILNQDINDVFGEKTLYKNYENDNKQRYNNYLKYMKEIKNDKNIFKNSFYEKNDNNSIINNNFQTIPSKM